MTDTDKDRLIEAFNYEPAPISSEERKRLAKLGEESGIDDNDLPFSFGPSFAEKLDENAMDETNNALKGHIVELARARGISIPDMMRTIKFGMDNLAGTPKYDA